jgi:hypothetical protein
MYECHKSLFKGGGPILEGKCINKKKDCEFESHLVNWQVHQQKTCRGDFTVGIICMAQQNKVAYNVGKVCMVQQNDRRPLCVLN